MSGGARCPACGSTYPINTVHSCATGAGMADPTPYAMAPGGGRWKCPECGGWVAFHIAVHHCTVVTGIASAPASASPVTGTGIHPHDARTREAAEETTPS